MADDVDVTPGTGKTIRTDDVGGVQYQIVKLAYGASGAATDVLPTSPLPVTNGSRVKVTTAKTRPANTTAYVAGEVINENDASGTAWTFPSCARVTGGAGTIKGAFIYDNANAAIPLQCELWLFDAAPAAAGFDNALFTPSDTEFPVAIIEFGSGTAKVGDATADAGGNLVLNAGVLDIPFVCAADANLYGVLVARNAYVPYSAEVFTISLFIDQD